LEAGIKLLHVSASGAIIRDLFRIEEYKANRVWIPSDAGGLVLHCSE
jgi:hypothetical protein